MRPIKDTVKRLIITRQVGMEDVESLLEFLLASEDEVKSELDDQRISEEIRICKNKRKIILEAVQIFSELGKKIHAIKFLRGVTGCSLKDGKEWVDRYFTWTGTNPVTDD